MNNLERSRRDVYLDSVAGILIIHMILYHCSQWSNMAKLYYQYSFLLYFFMPWFFFKAGMFYQERPSRIELKKSGKRLILPFIIFSALGTVVLWVEDFYFGVFTLREVFRTLKSFFFCGAVPGNLALWFLLSLFIVKILFNYIHIRFKKNDVLGKLIWGGVIICISTIYILLWLFRKIYGLNYPYYLSSVSSGFVFFTIGYLLRNFIIKSKIKTVLITIIYVVILTLYPVHVDMNTGYCDYGSIFLWVPMSLLGIISINAIGFWLLNRPSFLSYIGERSMFYYCFHWIVLILINSIIMRFEISESSEFIFYILGELLILSCLHSLTKRTILSKLV